MQPLAKAVDDLQQVARRCSAVSGSGPLDYASKQALVHRLFVCDAAGAFKPQAFVCTDQEAHSTVVLQLFVHRWSVEVTFAEVRRHLGVATQRQCLDLAIARTLLCLLALFSFVTL